MNDVIFGTPSMITKGAPARLFPAGARVAWYLLLDAGARRGPLVALPEALAMSDEPVIRVAGSPAGSGASSR